MSDPVIVREVTDLFLLHKAGGLDDAEFGAAKRAVFSPQAPVAVDDGGGGVAARRATKKGSGSASLLLYVRFADGETVAVEAPSDGTVGDVRRLLPQHRQAFRRAMFGGSELCDDDALADAGVTAEATIDVPPAENRVQVFRLTVVDTQWYPSVGGVRLVNDDGESLDGPELVDKLGAKARTSSSHNVSSEDSVLQGSSWYGRGQGGGQWVEIALREPVAARELVFRNCGYCKQWLIEAWRDDRGGVPMARREVEVDQKNWRTPSSGPEWEVHLSLDT